jgi:hypothetical protein
MEDIGAFPLPVWRSNFNDTTAITDGQRGLARGRSRGWK